MAIGILNKIKSFLPTRTLFTLYNTMILLHFNYFSLVWGRAAQCRLHQLIVLQKIAIRICSGAHFRAHCEPLFGTLGTLPLAKLVSFKTGVFMHKLQHDIMPSVFSTYFIKQNKIHSKNTRRSSDFRLPIFRTSFAHSQSIRYHGVNIWNKSVLPTNTLFTLYNTMILSHFNYFSLVWGRAAQCRLHKLIVLQKRAIRICSGEHIVNLSLVHLALFL